MRVGLVTSRYLARRGAPERRVHELACELVRRGAEVEVLTQESTPRPSRVVDHEGVVVRCFPTSLGRRRAVVPGIWEYLRRSGAAFDVIDVHAVHPFLAITAVWAGAKRLVFTPHAPMRELLSWSNAAVTRAVIDHSVCTVCASGAEADVLRTALRSAASRIRVIPGGVDVAAIRAATRFPGENGVVLAVGRLERRKRLDRLIAAMVVLGHELRLVVVGQGPARRRLEAHASDLLISPRVSFVGPLPDDELYRWLRTARVVVDLAEESSSGLQLLEARAAGVPAVVSDAPTHREAASYVGGDGVVFVPLESSPLDVAEAILDATAIRRLPAGPPRLPSWETTVDNTLALYEALAPTRAARLRSLIG
jgi:glycosyltransferase involved in cell wall biosynthesis